MNGSHKVAVLVVVLMISSASAVNVTGAEVRSQSAATNSVNETGPELIQRKSTIWQSGVGEGFLPTVQTFSVEAGVALGVTMFGGKEDHDLALLSLSYGHMLGQ